MSDGRAVRRLRAETALLTPDVWPVVRLRVESRRRVLALLEDLGASPSVRSRRHVDLRFSVHRVVAGRA